MCVRWPLASLAFLSQHSCSCGHTLTHGWRPDAAEPAPEENKEPPTYAYPSRVLLPTVFFTAMLRDLPTPNGLRAGEQVRSHRPKQPGPCSRAHKR